VGDLGTPAAHYMFRQGACRGLEGSL
jgi:hypothetical protein